MKKKIVIIGANSFQNRLILKAKERGYETHVFAWQCGDVGESTADFFYPISIVEKDKILEQCQKIKPDAVISIASDLAMLTVNYVAYKLRLPCNSQLCTQITTNKYDMRNALKNNNISTPIFYLLNQETYLSSLEKINKLFFVDNKCKSIIVKPTDRSGSRGITKLDSNIGLKEALERAFNESFSKTALVEEYLDGNEYSCECISYEGEHHFLAFTKKFTTGVPNFIETGHVQPSDISDEIAKQIIPEVFKALTALKITNGASHTEFKLQGNKIKIIEIGARMGGDCIGSDLVELSTGYDFLSMVLDVALGNPPCFDKIHDGKKATIKFIFNNEDLKELEKLKQINPNSIYFISDIDKIGSHEIKDSGTRFGYYITTD